MAAMASMPPTAPACNKMRLLPSRAADLSRRNSAASASAPTEISRQSIPRRSTASACSATAAWPATSATRVGLRASSSSSASTMSTPQSLARASSPRPGRASAPMMRTPLVVRAPHKAATTSCAMPPQPMRPTQVICRSLRIEAHARELPLRELLHRVTHAFAPEAARADAAEGIGVEPEAAGVVDPERADPEFARNLERGLEVGGEASPLQTEFGGVRGFENGAAALGLEHELGAVGNGVLDHGFDTVGGCAAHHRPDVDGGVVGIADLELLGRHDEQFEKAIEYRPLDDHPLRRDALLAARLEGRARN